MKAGDRIRVRGTWGDTHDYTVEEFRYCLGVFASDQHRMANNFTPLCELYERGADSKTEYISNYGEFYTNPVQAWMDLAK